VPLFVVVAENVDPHCTVASLIGWRLLLFRTVPAMAPASGWTGAEATGVVARESAEAVPYALVAVSRTRRVRPRSSELRARVVAVAPRISSQVAPDESQRRHWYVSVTGAVPDQVPGVTVRVSPACARRLIAGGVELLGAVPSSTPVWKQARAT
jgi:hypothetical protein